MLSAWLNICFIPQLDTAPSTSLDSAVTFDAVQTSLRVSKDNRFHIILDANGFEDMDKNNTALCISVQRPYPIEKIAMTLFLWSAVRSDLSRLVSRDVSERIWCWCCDGIISAGGR